MTTSRRKFLCANSLVYRKWQWAVSLVGQQAKTGERKCWDLKSQSELITLMCGESATTTTTTTRARKMLNQFKLANKMIINIIMSHKSISEKYIMRKGEQRFENCCLFKNMETKRDREFHHKCNTNCQSTMCYFAPTIIYILLHLLLIGATSSQATSHIRSTWVSREDFHHQEQIRPHNLPNDSHLRRPPPPISSERRLDFEEISAGGSERKQNAQLKAASEIKSDKFKGNTPGLHASASSLQPVAIEPEDGDYSGKQQVSQRRSSQPMAGDESFSHHSRAPPQFKIAHLSGAATNLSDELASSLEHRWMGQSHSPLVSATNMSASVSNAQVHFDEDHNNPQAGTSKLYSTDINDGRQDIFNTTEPTSNLAPKHETFDSQLQYANKSSNRQVNSGSRYGPAYQMPGEGDESDDLIDSLMMDNRTMTGRAFARGDQPNWQNFSQNARERDLHSHNLPSQMLEQPAIIYLPDGDKWNQPAPEEHSHPGGDRLRRAQDNHPSLLPMDDSRRQRRRPTHGNGDSFVFPQAGQDDATLNDATRSKVPDDIITARPIETVHWPHEGNTEPQHQPQLSYGFVSSGGQQTSQPSGGHLFYGRQVTTTTPMPIVYPAHFAQDLSSAMKEQIYLSQYANPTTVAPPITNFDLQPPRRQAQSTIMPQTLQQYIGSGAAHNYLPVPPRGQTLPFNHRAPAANRVINLGEAPQGSQFSASASGPRTSLFRNYSPMQLLGSGSKTKKSLLSTINEKFNTWTGSASDSDVHHLIESSFYEQPQNIQTTRRRRRPGMTQSGGGRGSTSRNRNIGPNHIVPHGYSLTPPPLLYGPIRQPTVAPAASTLGNFYGDHQASAGVNYYMSHPATGHHHHHQRHQSPGSQQQAANFIPVVAVQVTRTSPAPNAPEASSQVDKLDGDQYAWPQVSQPSTDSLSANEIDEYLASRTSHLSASKQQHAVSNLNDKQKWDDLFGNAAAASTGQRYQNGPRYQQASSPRARRRNVMSSSPGRQPLSPPPQPQHETTIKSAVFGYLPHQADAPLLQAMNMLQQLPAGQVQHHHYPHPHSSSHSSSGSPKQTLPDHNSYSSELYANQMDKSQQSVEAATPSLDYQSLAAVAAAAAAAATASQQQQQQQPFQATPFHAIGGPEEQPMSLALQLQANNYLQNDIAHPFGSQLSATTTHQQRASGGPKHAPLDVIYPSHQQTTSADPSQLHYPAFQFMSPSQFGAYQSQLAQIMAQNPLLTSQNQNNHHHSTVAGDDSSTPARAPNHPFQGYGSKHSELSASDNNLLTTAPNDLNPLLMSPVFYQNSPGAIPSTDPFYNFYQLTNGDQHKASSAQVNGDQSTSSGGQDSSSGGDQSAGGDQDLQTTVAPSEGSQRNQGLNSKGKKRSGDFFASAGQLLLSALPLLLAPTLGLMFASSPANPAARFHGSQLAQASGGLPGSLGVGGQSHGGQMNGMLDDGLVMNASPAPQLFTPSPPGSQFGSSAPNYAPDSSLSSLLTDRYNETFNDGHEATTTTTSTVTTSATSRPPTNQYYKTTNSLPALTGFRLDGPTRNRTTGSGGQSNRSATSGTTTHRPIAIILTTLGPTQPVAGANESTDLNSSASSGGDGEFGRNRTMSTILVLEDDDQEGDLGGTSNQGELLHSSGGQSNGTERQQDFQEPRRQQSAIDQQEQIRRSSSPPPAITTRVPSSTIMYDIGYEGADFDAQFATLRKNSLHKSPYHTTLAPLQLVNDRKYNSVNYNYVKDKGHYQYDELPSGAPIPARQTSDKPNNEHKIPNRFDESTPGDSSASNQQVNSKLFPVSSWPPMRRKTVSLITSSGNKTLLDSSDRYANLMAATGVNGNSRNRVSQNSKQHKIGTGSENQRNSSLPVSRPQTVIYDDEQPLMVHRASGRLEVGNQPNLIERRHSSRPNFLGTATTTRQQLNKKRLSTLDSFVVESAPPVDSSQPLRRKRDLSTGPLEAPASSNLIGLSGELSSSNRVRSQSKHVKATGQVVKLKKKSRKLLSRAKKRTKRVERRQDTPLADHYSPPIAAQNGTQLMYSMNQTDSGYPNLRDFSASHNLRHQTLQPVNMTTKYELGQPPEETLRRDASKSKSAIVTAMITHVADGGDDRDQDDAGQSEPSGQEDSAGMSHEELREQLLAKKLLLDRLATRTGGAQSASASTSDEQQQQQLDGPPEFNAGGRGRFKPAPVLDYVPFGLDQPLPPVSQQQNFSATRFINNRAATSAGSRNRLRSRNLMSELNEDTKRALAKFGTLLLEDTLEQLPPVGHPNETRRSYQAQSRKRSLSRPKYASSTPTGYSPAPVELDPFMPAAAPHSRVTSGQYDSYDIGSATERYSTRATQAPLPLSEDTPPGWSRHYPNERANGTTLGHHDNQLDRYNQDQVNYTRPPPASSNHSATSDDEWPKAAHRNDRTLTYQYPHGRERQQSHIGMGSPRNLSLAELDARYEHFDSARTSGVAQTGASRQQLSADDNYAPPGVGSQAVAFKTPGSGAKQDNGSPINKYNSFLMSHLGTSGAEGVNATGPARHTHNATSGSSSPGEQLDARYSTYSNYSTVAPAYHQHGHHLDGHAYHHDSYHHSHPTYDRYRDMPPAEYPPHDPRTPRSPGGGQYPSSYDTRQYNTQHYNDSYPPPPPPPPGIGHYSHPDRHISTHRATANYPESYRDIYQRQPIGGDEQPPSHHHQSDLMRGTPAARNQYPPDHNPVAVRYYSHLHYNQPQHYAAHHQHSSSSTTYAPASSHHNYGEREPPPPGDDRHPYQRGENHYGQQKAYDPAAAASRSSESTKSVNDYLKRVQFSDSDRDKLMASYLTCDGLLNDNDHCLERLSCEFSDPQNIEKANKLDRAVSSILLGHILINTYIPKAFKLRLKSASLFGYTQSGKCSKFACSKLTTRQSSGTSPLDSPSTPSTPDDDTKSNNIDR